MSNAEKAREKMQTMAKYLDEKKAQTSNAEGLAFLDQILEVMFDFNTRLEVIEQENRGSTAFVEIDAPHRLR